MTAQHIPTVTLSDGRAIPQLGFGTYQVPPEETERVVSDALAAGVRHLDTAQLYQNEEGVGRAVAASGIPRDELWITTKLGNGNHAPDDARRSAEASLEALGGEIDLFLVHWPLAMIEPVTWVWEVMEQLRADLPIRSIGVSNFQVAHLEELASAGLSTPVVNQVESNPYFLNDEVRGYGAEHGIVTEAWSPLAQGNVLEDPQLVALAEQLGKSVSQVVLRWVLQRGDVVFPKSMKRERIEQNLDVFDFELSEEQMASVSALNRDERTGPDPDTFDWRG